MLLLGVVGVERRGRVVCGVVRWVNRTDVREELDGHAEVARKMESHPSGRGVHKLARVGLRVQSLRPQALRRATDGGKGAGAFER